MGSALRRLRRAKDLTQKEVADILGIKPPSYFKYEADVVVPPGDKLMQLAQLFGVTIDYLMNPEPVSEERTVPVSLRQLAQAQFAELLKHAGDDLKKLEQLNAALRACREKL